MKMISPTSCFSKPSFSKKMLGLVVGGLLPLSLFSSAWTKTTVDITSTTTPTQSYGQVIFLDRPSGLLVVPTLNKLPAGLHGFHVHQHANCEHDGKSAGDHYDPKQTGKHLGPYENGHLGDLPALYVDQSGKAMLPTIAPHLKEADLAGHAVIVHAGGDNYSDEPAPNGGGGARLACGIVKSN